MSATTFTLARVEARRLVRHPAYLVGAALTVWAYVGIGMWDDGAWVTDIVVVTLVLLGWATIVAADLCALRSRRNGTQDLLTSLPTTEESRTAAHLLSSIAALLGGVVIVVAMVGYHLAFEGASGMPAALEVVTGLVLVLGGGVAGVFVARWLPSVGFGYAAIVVVTMMQGFIGSGTVGNRKTYLAFLPPEGEFLPGWPLEGLLGVHLAWVLAWTALLGLAAASRRRVTANGRIIGAVALLTIIATAVVMLRPLAPDVAEARAADLNDHRHATACEVLAETRYCAYPSEVGHIEAWAGVVDRVFELVPAVQARPMLVDQRAPWVVEDTDCAPRPLQAWLPAEVSARLDPTKVWPDDGRIHPVFGREGLGCGTDAPNWFHLAVQVGSFAVGLPPADHDAGRRCEADGQARAALALWFGLEAEGAQERLAEMLADTEQVTLDGHLDFVGNGPVMERGGWSVPPPWGTRFSVPDAQAAIRLLSVERDTMLRVVDEHWTALRDPATPTSTLLAWAGLGDSEAPVEPVASGHENPCRASS